MGWGNSLAYRSTTGNATAQLVKGLFTRVVGMHIINPNDEDSYLHIYNASAAADVTVGTTTPVQTYVIPAGDGVNVGAYSDNLSQTPLQLETGFVWAITKAATGSTNPDTDCIVNFLYT